MLRSDRALRSRVREKAQAELRDILRTAIADAGMSQRAACELAGVKLNHLTAGLSRYWAGPWLRRDAVEAFARVLDIPFEDLVGGSIFNDQWDRFEEFDYLTPAEQEELDRWRAERAVLERGWAIERAARLAAEAAESLAVLTERLHVIGVDVKAEDWVAQDEETDERAVAGAFVDPDTGRWAIWRNPSLPLGLAVAYVDDIWSAIARGDSNYTNLPADKQRVQFVHRSRLAAEIGYMTDAEKRQVYSDLQITAPADLEQADVLAGVAS